MAAGDRVLYGQRVDGVVRVTDVPQEAGGRAYLVERGLEEERADANAALQALIADYLCRASVLDAVQMTENLLLLLFAQRHAIQRPTTASDENG